MFKIEIIKETVEAKSRKLSAKWTMEEPQIMMVMHDDDKELFVSQTSELTYQIHNITDEIKDWLQEIHYEYNRQTLYSDVFVQFKDKQGAMEFKLRFINV
jgi:hypothetical protein